MDLPSSPDRERLKVLDAEYSVESEGHKTNEPVVHLFCRDEDQNRRRIDVEGFRPYFYISLDEFRQEYRNVVNDRHVVGVEASLCADEWEHILDENEYQRLKHEDSDDQGRAIAEKLESEGSHVSVYHKPDTATTLHDESLVKIITIEPAHVGKIREFWPKTWEADVPFTRRFLISTGIRRGIEIPAGADRVRYENWDGHSGSTAVIREIEPADPPDVGPRVLVTDIEVATHGGGVPAPGKARNEITAITAYDSYTEEYAGWVLQPDEWEKDLQGDEFKSIIDDQLSMDLDRMEVFERETIMVEDFHQWVTGHDFDLVTGWNCLPEDEEVLMADGSRVSISNIEVGDKVVGIDGDETTVATVKEKMMTGVKETVEIKPHNGESIRCTPDHEVLVGDNSGIEWTEARNISTGDYILTVKNHPSTETECPVSPKRAYQYGLIASDGSFNYGEGVKFYNTRQELHDQFETTNTVSWTNDGSASQRVFTDKSREDAVSELESVGIPSGAKKDKEWDLSPIMSWDDDLIAAFIAGMFDGDGTTEPYPSIAALNNSCRYWIKRLLRCLGIWATSGDISCHIGSGSVERFYDLIEPYMNHSEKKEILCSMTDSSSGRESNIPGYIVTEGRNTSGDGVYRRVNEYIKRDDVSLKRHHAESVDSKYADTYTDFVFDVVDTVEESERSVCYDIQTTASSYVASERVVHNCNGFDYPYIIQRSYNISAYTIRDWADADNSPFNAGDDWPDPVIEGVVTFDMLDAYEKTQFRDLRSYSLEHVAQEELGYGKEDLEDDLDVAWKQSPVEFMTYNVRDVQAVVEIEKESELLDLYDNLRDLTGALYNTCNHNGPMIDTLFLRRAFESGYVLPTNEQVPPEEGKYHGAKVFDPVPGRHDTCVYPDLSSMYPNLFAMLNLGEETIIGNREDLKASKYTMDDVYRFPVDQREFATIPKGESYAVDSEMLDSYKGVLDESGSVREMFDPQYDDMYVLKPGIKQSFIREVIDDLIELKYQYSGKRYEAVKRITNSCFTPDTEVLTPTGVVNITDLDIGDNVYSLDPETNNVEVKPIVDTIEKPDYRGTIVDVQTSRIDLSMTPDHRMIVKRRRYEDEYEWTTAGELNEYTRYELPNEWSFDHGSAFGDTVDVSNLVSECENVSRDVIIREDRFTANKGHGGVPIEWDTNDFVAFIGWFITEGNTYHNEQSGWYIDISQKSGEGRKKIQSLLDRIGLNYYEDKNGFRMSSKLLAPYLDSVCGVGSNNKRLPKWVWSLSEERKQLLLETLMDGDGDRYSGNRYSTQSTDLRDQVLRLCTELGYNARYRQDSNCWRVRFDSGYNTFQMKRGSGQDAGSTRQAENGVYCVTVKDNHTLLAGRNGSFNWVGNCYGVAGDSDSGRGKGFRLFNRLVAEGITLAGRLTIEFTAHQFTSYLQENFDESAYLVAGDTDSCVSSISGASSYGEALEWSFEAVDHVEDKYDAFVREQFDFTEGDDHRLAVDIESLASSLFYIQDLDADKPENEAVKKRYAQNIIWDDDDGWIDEPDSDVKHENSLTLGDYTSGGILEDHDASDHIKIKGFEYVRSDSATVTKESQKKVLTYVLLTDDPIEYIDSYINDLVDKIKSGRVPAEDIGRPKGIKNNLDDYGWKTVEELEADSNYTVTQQDRDNGGRYVSTPGPTYRGHKYAVDHIPWESLGNKPVRLYIDKIAANSEYPEVYEYDQFPEDDRPDPPEVGRQVDAIAVNDPSRLPDAFVLDIDEMIGKELEDKLNPIFVTVGSSWDGIVGDGRQVGFDAFQ